MTLPFAVYTAWRGYAWSSVPEGLTTETLDGFYRKVRECRPDFLGGDDYVEGVHVDADGIVVFRVQNVPKWDSVGRSADYCAFAFVSAGQAAAVDFGALLAMDAFRVPDRSPPSAIDYTGPTSVVHDEWLVKRLQDRGSLSHCDFRAIGDILRTYGTCCPEWLFRRQRLQGAEDVFVTTGPWECVPEAWVRRKLSTFTKIDPAEIRRMLEEGK